MWTKEEKRKMQQEFQPKYLMKSALKIREYYYVFNCSKTKEVWDILKQIYKVTTEMEKERMNTLIQEAETPSHNEANLQRWFSNIKTLGNNFKSIVFN